MMCEYKFTGRGDDESEAKCFDRHWDNDEVYENDAYQDSIQVFSQFTKFDRESKIMKLKIKIAKAYETSLGS